MGTLEKISKSVILAFFGDKITSRYKYVFVFGKGAQNRAKDRFTQAGTDMCYFYKMQVWG